MSLIKCLESVGDISPLMKEELTLDYNAQVQAGLSEQEASYVAINNHYRKLGAYLNSLKEKVGEAPSELKENAPVPVEVDAMVETVTTQEDSLVNDYFDIHWSVLTNKDMHERMMAPLDKTDLSDEAKLLNKNVQTNPYFFSAAYKLNDFQSMKGAKALVGLTSLALTHNAVIQDKSVTLNEFDAESGSDIVKTSITAAGLELTQVSGYGETTYKGMRRTKADNIQAQQSESVDHAKNRIIDKLNLNPYTVGASLAMSRMQTPDEGTPGSPDFKPGQALPLTFNTRMLMQPIIKEFAALMAKSGDSLSTDFGNIKEKVYNQLRESYTAQLPAAGTFQESILDSTPEGLLKAMELKGHEFIQQQLQVLSLFEQFDSIGDQLGVLQTLTAQDTRGAGKDILTAFDIHEKRGNPGWLTAHPKFLLAATNVEGVFKNHEGFDNETGVVYESTITPAVQLFQDELPYHKINHIYEYIQTQSGRTELGPTQKKKIFGAVKSFLLADSQLGLFQDAEKERMRLMYGKDSLAKRLHKAKISWGRNNYFLQRLSTVVSPDGLRPDFVEYIASKADRSDDLENSRAWLSLLQSEDMQQKQLGEDLLRYLFITGGTQSARNYVKFIPWAVFEGTGIAERLSKSAEELSAVPTDQFGLQYFQHNPSMAKQLSKGLQETGKEYETPPSNFAAAGEAAEGLKVEVMQDGKKMKVFPDFLSHRNEQNNKWTLYRYVGFSEQGAEYMEVNLLGDKTSTVLEYSSGPEVDRPRSIFAENRVAVVEEVKNDSLKALYPIASARALEAVGIVDTSGTKEDLMIALEVISIDAQQPSHLRVLASAFTQMERNSAEAAAAGIAGVGSPALSFRLDTQIDTGGQFNSTTNRLHLNPKEISFKQQAAEILTHEMLHYHTAFLTMAYGGPETWGKYNQATRAALARIHEFIKNNPDLDARMKAMDDIRKDALQRFKAKIIADKGIAYWNLLEKNGEGANNYDYNTYYGLATLAEFVPGVLTSPQVMNFLNNQRYEGTRSILDHIKDLFAQFWGALMDALGIASGTMLEESVKRVLDVVTYQQTLDMSFNKSMTADFSGDIINQAPPSTQQIDSIDAIIGKLDEEKWKMISSQPQIKDPAMKARRKREIEQIEEQIANLIESKDLLMVPEVAKLHLKWIEATANKPAPTINELNSALSLANLWKNVNEVMFKEVEVDDVVYIEIAAKATNLERRLNSKVKVAMQHALSLEDKDFSEARLQDVDKIEALTRSLQSSAKNAVVSKLAQFVSTVGRQEDEDIQREIKNLADVEAKVKAYAKSKGIKVEDVYKKLTAITPENWGRTMQYSSTWFATRNKLIAIREGKLANIEQIKDSEIIKKTMKAKVWFDFYTEMNKFSVGINTAEFFDEETGQFKADVSAAKKALADKVGEKHVDVVLQRAQERYLAYLEERNNLFALIDEEVASGEKTLEDAHNEKTEFRNRHSPNVFFSKSGQRSMDGASENYVTYAPLASAEDMWNEDFKEIQDSPELSEIYRMYYGTIDRLVSYLPITEQKRAGNDFLPVVAKSEITDVFDIASYLRTFNERAVRSITASKYEENMAERMYKKIPVQYVSEREVEQGDRSTDLIGIARVFATMATHYRHASAAKDVIQMGQSILAEVHKARVEGSAQTEQNGRIVTVKKGLDNALEALDYMVDYMIYRKPKDLEFNLSGKFYARVKDGQRKFSMNPLEQRRISKEISQLLLERKELERQFAEEEVFMDAEEFAMAVAEIDKKLEQYEGFTLYGSKLGDKLISINQLKALSYNPFSAAANLSFGMISGAIHAAGKADYTMADYGWAMKKLLAAKTDKKLADKILNTMDRLGVIGDFIDSRYGKRAELRDQRPKWKRAIDPYAMLRSTDFFMKAATSLAMLKHITTKVNGEDVSIWDTLDEKGAWMEDKYGEDKTWYNPEDVTTQTQWDKLKNRIVKANMIIHGNQDKNSPKLANKFILGRLFGQFRMSWLPEGWYNRFQSERFDDDLGRAIKGRYRSYAALGLGGTLSVLGRQFVNLIPGVKTDIAKGIIINKTNPEKIDKLANSEVDMENLRRNFAELNFYLVMTAAILMIKGLRDDDDDNVGLQIALNMMIRTKQDIDMYASPAVFNAVFRNPIPAADVVADYMKAVGASYKLMFDSEYEFQQWALKMTKAGLPIPQATQVNKWKYMIERDLDQFQ